MKNFPNMDSDASKSPCTQSTPLFLKGSEGFGERGKTSFPARSAGCEKTRPSLRWGSDTCKSPFTQSTPLFVKRCEGFGEKRGNAITQKNSHHLRSINTKKARI